MTRLRLGKVRLSTVILLLVFLLAFVGYFLLRPDPTKAMGGEQPRSTSEQRTRQPSPSTTPTPRATHATPTPSTSPTRSSTPRPTTPAPSPTTTPEPPPDSPSGTPSPTLAPPDPSEAPSN
ncbi:hypothetical protein AB0J82_17745 [Asanoa sp. NPDC049518]|uniref:hypothetical protein n=1 Tax=unclassified Asanoa TaxID=2685164 RepID=UPI00343502DE